MWFLLLPFVLIGFILLIILWPFVFILSGILILFNFWPKKEHQCAYCSEKFYSIRIRSKHLETCVVAKKQKEQQRKRKQEEQRQWDEQQRKWKEQQCKEEHKREDWRKNWKTKNEWNFSEEEFWKIQEDIDKRKENATKVLEKEKEKATEKLWERYYAAKSSSLEDRIQDEIDNIDAFYDEKIEEIEEEFEEEEERLWEQFPGNDEYRRAKEGWSRAKEDWKRKTGNEWHENDWKRNWDEAYESIFGKKINIEECYKTLGLAAYATFDQVKKRFRELALKFHPDKAQDKKTAEVKFKKIYEAYETIKINQSGGVKA